jgi:hypothetical protein
MRSGTNHERTFLSYNGWLMGPRWLALILIAICAPIFFSIQITHDAAWQMWIGRQLLYGADLYTDIIEINPPLWFWLAEPLAAVSRAMSIDSLDTLVAFFIVCITISMLLIDRLMHDWPDRRRLLLLIAFVIVAMPPGNFGQREQFTLIATVPYVLLIGRRASGRGVTAGLAIIVGCFAAVGFALKPHFALVPAILELWLRRSIVRPETIMLAVIALIYGASVVLIEPDYFTNIVPLARKAYGSFGHFRPLILCLTAIPFVFAFFVRPARDGVSGALLVAALTFYLVFVWQLKGFAYQALPAMGLLVLALVASLHGSTKVQATAALGAAALAILPNLVPYHTSAWADVPKGSSYAALSVAPRAAWPLVEERQLTWPLNAISLWMAPAVQSKVRASVIRDLQCNPPTYLLVDDRKVDFTQMFPEIIDHYVPLWRRNHVTLMKLARPLPRQTMGCRSIR